MELKRKDLIVLHCIVEWNINQMKNMGLELPNNTTPSATQACTITKLCQRPGKGAVPLFMKQHNITPVMDDPTQVYRVIKDLKQAGLVTDKIKGQFAHTKEGLRVYDMFRNKNFNDWPLTVSVKNGRVSIA